MLVEMEAPNTSSRSASAASSSASSASGAPSVAGVVSSPALLASRRGLLMTPANVHDQGWYSQTIILHCTHCSSHPLGPYSDCPTTLNLMLTVHRMLSET